MGWEDALEEDMATRSSILAWRTPWMEETVRGARTVSCAWWATGKPMGSQRVGQD